MRVFKNMNSRLVVDGLIKPGITLSHYIDGLLYNVPSVLLGTNYRSSVANAIVWYRNEADKTQLICASRQYYLLRDGSLTC